MKEIAKVDGTNLSQGGHCHQADASPRLWLLDLFTFSREGKMPLGFVGWDFSFEGSAKQWEHLLPPESEEA